MIGRALCAAMVLCAMLMAQPAAPASLEIVAYGPEGAEQPVPHAFVCAKVVDAPPNARRAGRAIGEIFGQTGDDGRLILRVPPSSLDFFAGRVRVVVEKPGWCPIACEAEFFWDVKLRRSVSEVDACHLNMVPRGHSFCRTRVESWLYAVPQPLGPRYYDDRGRLRPAGDRTVVIHRGDPLTCRKRQAAEGTVPRPMPEAMQPKLGPDGNPLAFQTE